MREYYPYHGQERRLSFREMDEQRLLALEAVTMQVVNMMKAGIEITYPNLQDFPPRFRAMMRHYYLNAGNVYRDRSKYDDDY